MVPMIVRVYGDDADNTCDRHGGACTDVPVTPHTTCRDLVECCRDPGDEDCELVAIWANNCERALRENDRPLEILQKWGSGKDSVKLVLRYTPLQDNGTSPGVNGNRERSDLRNGMKEPGNFEETLPDGVALTLGELRDMAWRQQHQLEAQHRLLAAREQRLRHLKEQEMARVAGENERLRRLRERVDAQELKLRRLRALRGQVDHAKHNNALLTSDLESIRALFNEKEKELSVAVAKVDELTRQLEELRRGRQSEPPTGASLELEKLRRELMYRNKFNEQQNAKLSQQREALTQRQEEIINIDKRISELQDRLNRKRVLNQQLANQIASTNKTTNQVQPNPSMIQQNPPMLLENPHPILTKQHSRGNIAAIEPYNHVPLPTPDQNHFVEKPKQPASAFFTQTNSNQVNQNNANNLKPQKQEEPAALKAPNEQVKNESNDFIAEFNGSKSDPKYQTLPYNTKFSVNFVSTTKVNKDVQLQDADKNINEADSVQNVNSKATHQPHMTVHSTPLSTINKGLAVPLSQNDNTYHDKFMQQKQQNELKNALHHLEQPPRALHPHNGSARGQPVGGPSTSSSSISTVINNNNLNINQQKPISSVAPTSLHLGSNKPSAIYQTSSMKIQPVQPQTIQTTLQTPSYSHNTNGNIHAQQMVLTPPNSTSTPLGTPDTIPKPVLPPKPAIKPPPRQMQPITDLDKDITPPPIPTSEPPQESIPSNQQVKQHDNKPIKARPLTIKKQPLGEQQPKLRNIPKLNGVHVSINRRIEMPPAFLFPEMSTPPSDLISINQNENTNNSNKTTVNNNTIDNLTQSKSNTQQKSQDETDKAVPDDKISELEEENKKNALDKVPMNVGENLVVRRNKGNLKQNGKVNLSRRVSFDPLALLLDASLEGELELVKKTATQVTNPSAANDEGITALHNAICAGHLEIVQFLVEFGCDVNAQDSDGWTPLHCAASCNNVAMVKFLVEHGACIFATTLSDHETAAEKCEEDEEGFDGCSEYLYSVQEKLGILSGGAVFAVFDYVAQQADELNFSAGQQLTVLRKGDENEREWWWARLGDKEGYIPRNLLGLYPRVIPKSE